MMGWFLFGVFLALVIGVILGCVCGIRIVGVGIAGIIKKEGLHIR